MDKPQSVINWLNQYKLANEHLAELRRRRNMMIFHAYDNRVGVTEIARMFNMQQQNVSHIIKNRAAYEAGLSAKKEES